jgi:hypothetical protein
MAKHATRGVVDTSKRGNTQGEADMTIASRRLARRCRERFTKERGLLPCPAPAETATVNSTDIGPEAQLEKVDAAK